MYFSLKRKAEESIEQSFDILFEDGMTDITAVFFDHISGFIHQKCNRYSVDTTKINRCSGFGKQHRIADRMFFDKAGDNRGTLLINGEADHRKTGIGKIGMESIENRYLLDAGRAPGGKKSKQENFAGKGCRLDNPAIMDTLQGKRRHLRCCPGLATAKKTRDQQPEKKRGKEMFQCFHLSTPQGDFILNTSMLYLR